MTNDKALVKQAALYCHWWPTVGVRPSTVRPSVSLTVPVSPSLWAICLSPVIDAVVVVSLAATTLFAAPVVVIAGGRLFEGGVLLMFNETGESSATELLYEDTFPADYL